MNKLIRSINEEQGERLGDDDDDDDSSGGSYHELPSFSCEEKAEIISTLNILKKSEISFEEREDEFTTMCFKAGMLNIK